MSNNPKPTWQIGGYHKEVIIDFFRHVMTQEQRQRFMREHPAAYNEMFDTPGEASTVMVLTPSDREGLDITPKTPD